MEKNERRISFTLGVAISAIILTESITIATP